MAWQRRTGEFEDLYQASYAPAPDVSVIRRWLRRRRARMAITGTVICALAAGAVVLVHTPAPAPASMVGPGQIVLPPCGGGHLRAGWAAAPVASKAFSVDPLPSTYVIDLRNTGRAVCSVKGWPKLSVISPRALQAVPVSYGTVSVRVTRRGSAFRVVEPTYVTLRPGGRAAVAVTVTYPPNLTGCARPVWLVTPLHGRTSTDLPSGGRGAPLVCDHSAIVVSPAYPAFVPASQNYPPKAPRQSPAAVSTSPPVANAGPQAAPYFVVLDGFRPHVVVVTEWRTGKLTAAIRLPGIAEGVAGAGDDRTFVVAVGGRTGVTRFYQLVLSLQGTLDQPLAPLPVPPVADANPRFAVSDDGSELALAVPQPGGNGEDDEIMVLSLVTGAVRTWRSPDPGAVFGMSWADPGSSPATAWAGNNRLLFSWAQFTPGGQIARQSSGLRLLNITAPGSSLLASRVVIPASVRVGGLTGLGFNPLINSAGTVVFATMETFAHGNPRAAVVEFGATTGRPLGIVTPLAGESGMGAWCGALWVNPSGSRALADCGGWEEITQGRFTPVDLHFPGGTFSHGTNYFAW